MQLTVLTTMFDHGSANAFINAAALGEKPDMAAVETLCARLTGMEDGDADAIADRLLDCPMPRGFMHARVFDAADGVEISSVLVPAGKKVTVEQISLLVSLSEKALEGRWVETTPLPMRDPGVLDLLVRFGPRV